MTSRRVFLKTFVISPIVLMACSHRAKFNRLPKQAKVVALGDSLTFGYGAKKGEDYPSVLGGLTGWNIDNMGVNGDTSEDVLARLEAVIAKKPKLVLLGIGGNDVLRKVSPTHTQSNIDSIIKNLQENAIAVVLIAQPHLSISALFGKASDNPIYKEIGKRWSIPVFSQAWSDILSNEALKSDKIHANALGYELFAKQLFAFLQKIGYA